MTPKQVEKQADATALVDGLFRRYFAVKTMDEQVDEDLPAAVAEASPRAKAAILALRKLYDLEHADNLTLRADNQKLRDRITSALRALAGI
jgi:hypothetical protein